MLLYWLIMACLTRSSSAEMLANYQTKQTDETFEHPLASTSYKDNPPITIEVTPFNDTIINVYFASAPQRIAIIIYLTNSPHPFNTGYSSILIVTNPSDLQSPVYSGTITFMSPTENSTVGFHIPPSPNGAIITVDVPRGPMNSGDNQKTGNTKIRLIHLGDKSAVSTTKMTTITARPTTASNVFQSATTSIFFNVSEATEIAASTTPAADTTDLVDSWPTNRTATDDSTLSEDDSTVSYIDNFTELSTLFPHTSSSELTDEFTNYSYFVPTTETLENFTVPFEMLSTPEMESSSPFGEPEATSDILVSSTTDIVAYDSTDVPNDPSSIEAGTSSVPKLDETMLAHTTPTEEIDVISPTTSYEKNSTITTKVALSSTYGTAIATNDQTTSAPFPAPTTTSRTTLPTLTTLLHKITNPNSEITDRSSTSLPTQIYPKTTEMITKPTCPTLYNIYLKLNITASINKTRVGFRDDEMTTSRTATFTTERDLVTERINDSTEISSPRKVQTFTGLLSTPMTSLVPETTTMPIVSSATTKPPITITTQNYVATTALPTVSTPVSMAPTTFWIISIIIAKVDINDTTFIQDITSALEAAYNEAYKRQQKQIFGLFSSQSRIKRQNNNLIILQMVNVTKNSGQHEDEIELIYYLTHNGTYIPVNASLNAMELLDDQEAALLLGHRVIVKAKPYIQAPTSESYHKSEQKSDMLPVILGSLAGILLIIVIVIIILRLKCMKKKFPIQEASPTSTNLGEQNRIQALEDDIMTVVVDGRGEGGTRSKLTSENLLPIPLDSDAFRTPPPKPKRRRPLPALPEEYAKPIISEETLREHSTHKIKRKHFVKVQTQLEAGHSVYNENQLAKVGGLLEYLNESFSQIPQEAHENTAVEFSDDKKLAEKNNYEVSAVGTQTDGSQPSTRRVSNAEQELEVIGNELQWQTIKRKMQELIDDAFAVLKNKKPSPRFRGSRLQPLSASAIPTDTSIVNMEEVNSISSQVSPSSTRWLNKPPLIEVQSTFDNDIYSRLSTQQRPLQINVSQSHKTAVNDVFPTCDAHIDQRNEHTIDLDVVRTYHRPRKDLETAYLLTAIKDELKKFKQNFSSADETTYSQSINI